MVKAKVEVLRVKAKQRGDADTKLTSTLHTSTVHCTKTVTVTNLSRESRLEL
jgi:hypothetical protein